MLRLPVPEATPLSHDDADALLTAARLLPGYRVSAEVRLAGGRDVADRGESLAYTALSEFEPVRRPRQHKQATNRIALAAVSDGSGVRHQWSESLTEWPHLMAASWLADGVVSQPVRLVATLTGGTSSWHVPDLLVEDGRRCLIDVRDRSAWDLSFAGHVAWTSAFAQSLGLDYFVATSLSRIEVANLMRIAQAARSGRKVQARADELAAKIASPRRVHDLINSGRRRALDYQAFLWLIWTRRVSVPFERPIGVSTVVRSDPGPTTLRSFLAGRDCLHEAASVLDAVAGDHDRGWRPTDG